MTDFRRLSILALALVTAASLGACGTRRNNAQALRAQIPDDFRVVARAPLVLPPEYALRPPTPGEPRPQELDPESAARTALVGAAPDPNSSPAERALVAKAGGVTADPLIRQVIDDEQGDLAHKTKSFADLVMFWRPGQPNTPSAAPAPGANTSTPIDAAAEAQRITELTGNAPISIQRDAAASSRGGLKLPGL